MPWLVVASGRSSNADSMRMTSSSRHFVAFSCTPKATSISWRKPVICGVYWRALLLNKLHRQIESQTAEKRSVDREEPADLSIANATAPEPSAAEVIAIVEELQLVVDSLTPNERLVFTSILQGRSMEEVGGLIGKSERTVRRLLAGAKRRSNSDCWSVNGPLMCSNGPSRSRTRLCFTLTT